MTTLEEALAAPGAMTERAFNCPDHDDTRASASVNIDAGVWFCYACGARGTVGGKHTRPGRVKMLLEALAGDTPPREYPHTWLDLFDGAGPSAYWADRFNEPVAVMHRTGTHPWAGTDTYPLWSPDGRPWGVVQRTDGTPKYVYPVGVPVSQTLYRAHDVPLGVDVLLLVEGAADVMAFDMWFHGGMPLGLSVAAVGSYGCSLHAPQITLIGGLAPRRVLVAYDNDDAGRRGTAAAVAALNREGVEALPLPTSDMPKGSDLADMVGDDPDGEWMVEQLKEVVG